MHFALRKFLTIPLFCVIASAQGAILRVPTQYPSVQSGIDAATNGDVVLVAPGTYLENISFEGKAIQLVSESGPAATILDGQNAGAVVTFTSGETRSSVLSGFTIRNGSSDFGSGISLLGASATIIGNIFETNNIVVGYYGAAIGGNGASPDIEKNIFRYNATDDQLLAGVVSFVNSSSPLIANNLFYDNPGRAINLTLPEGNSPVVVNNTIVRNRCGVRVDGRVNASAISIFNNIVVGNDVGLEIDFGSPPTWQYNLVGGNTTDYQGVASQTGLNGNISGMPSFVSSANDDFRLLSDSLGIDAGDNAAPQLPVDDFRGYQRIIAGQINGPAIVDMGAYELNPDFSRPLVTTLPAQGTNADAILSGLVNPNGLATAAWFEWGTTPIRSYLTTPLDVGDGRLSVPVNVSLSGLIPGVAYHYHTVATNGAGISIGRNEVFQTPALSLIGPPVMTNWYHTEFIDPGASAQAAPLAIAAGGAHSLALKADGTVVGWGFSANGEINIPADATNIVAIAAGEGHSVALRADGSVIAWGGGSFDRTNVPPEATNVVAIAAGEMHSLALRGDGSVVSWGWSYYGQTNVPPEATNIIGIAGGIYRSMALKSDGTIITWGRDVFGENQVPANATNILAIASGWYHSVALKTDGTVIAWGAGTTNTGSFPDFGESIVPDDATNIIAISASDAHTLALRADGAVIAWGLNDHGQTNVPPNVTNAVAIAAGYNHSLALLADGSVVGWGINDYGETTIPSDLSITGLPVTVDGVMDSNALHTYTLTYTATNQFGHTASATRTVVVPGAQQMKSAVLDDMANSITNQATNSVRLNQAIKNLQQGLAEGLWADETHLNAKMGGRVFSKEAQAVMKLNRLMKQKGDQPPDAKLQEWIMQLVAADRFLAAIEIEEAGAIAPAGGKLAQANQEFTAGDDAAAKQKYVAAISHYAAAWQKAEQSVNNDSQANNSSDTNQKIR